MAKCSKDSFYTTPQASGNLYSTPISQPWWYRNRGTTRLPSSAKQTTKLRGNFVTREEIGAALFFAFMLGGAAVGLYVDFINKAHPCDAVPCKAVPCVQIHKPHRFGKFN